MNTTTNIYTMILIHKNSTNIYILFFFVFYSSSRSSSESFLRLYRNFRSENLSLLFVPRYFHTHTKEHFVFFQISPKNNFFLETISLLNPLSSSSQNLPCLSLKSKYFKKLKIETVRTVRTVSTHTRTRS